jgi:5-methylcytosine-specific restriction endonuclease McrA
MTQGHNFPHTHETKEKISKANKGKHYSPRTEFKPGNIPVHAGRKRPEHAGENHYNWRGGITSLDSQIRHSFEYREWRTKVYERDNYTCQVCKERGKRLCAHHPFSFSEFPELRFNVDNGVTLCVECHWKIHGKKEKKNDV